MLSPNEAAYQMRQIRVTLDWDAEQAHAKADELVLRILKEQGFDAMVSEYNRIGKWYA